jgi:ribosome production factor 2
LKRPLALRFTKKNAIHPFEDPSSLEFFSQKNDASLLCFSSHSKKRPHCLTFTRCFAGKILDILECTVVQDSARTLMQFGGSKCRIGTKPLLSFSGSQFEASFQIPGERNKFAVAKSMFTDFFRGENATEVDVEGLQMLISFAAADQQIDGHSTQLIYMRVWKILTKRSGQRLPRVEVEEIGPRIDFVLGRVRNAEDSTLKEALKRSKGAEVLTTTHYPVRYIFMVALILVAG